jgi:hypothetical protein
MIGMDSVISRSSTILSVDVHMDTVLLSVQDGLYYNFSSTSRDLWARLDKPVRVDRLCAELVDAYAADPAVIEADTLKFLARLHELGLIEAS